MICLKDASEPSGTGTFGAGGEYGAGPDWVRLPGRAAGGSVNSGMIPVGICGRGLSTILFMTAAIREVFLGHTKGRDA